MRDCPACAKQVPDDAKRCPFCRTAVVKACPYCAEEIQAAAIYCRFCKSDLSLPPGSAGATRFDASEAKRIRRQITFQRVIAIVFGVPGLAIQLFGFTLRGGGSSHQPPPNVESMGSCVHVIGMLFLMVCLWFYAKSKGRNPAWAFIAVLSCFGLLIVALLGKACRKCRKLAGLSATQCGQCGAPM